MNEFESKYAKDTAIARIVHLERDNSELRKDKERLDWLLNYEGSYWLLNDRNDIDREMEE